MCDGRRGLARHLAASVSARRHGWHSDYRHRPADGCRLAGGHLGRSRGGWCTGGIVAALIEAGIDEDDAPVFAEGVKRGGARVTVRAHEHEVAAVDLILKRHHPVDVAARRREYEDAGWSGFSVDDPWEASIGNEDK